MQNHAVFDRLRDHMAEKVNRLVEVFRDIDESGDGKVTKKELSRGLTQLGVSATAAEIDEVFGILDKDGDGSVVYRELARVLKATDKNRGKSAA